MILPAAAHIVGREPELEAIAGLFDERPGTRALLIDGEAGMGKTTIWEWGVERAPQLGFSILRCGPAEAEAALPFSALGDLLDPVLAEISASLPPRQRLALETALAMREPDESFDWLAVARAGLAALNEMARDGPIALAIDDVQWLDRATARVLEFAARRLDHSRVRLLLARRSERDGPAPLDLDRSLEAGQLVRARVGPLPVRDLDLLLRWSLDVRLPRPNLLELHRVTGGNPFYALEMARRAVRQGASLADPLAVPESLAELLREELDELSPPARLATLLTAASTQSTAQVVERAAGGNEGLTEAIGRAVLELDGQRLRFSHPLLGSVAYGSALPWEQRDAHARLASAATDRGERARHLALATEQADGSIAVELDEAAERAYRRGASSAAAELSDHACRLTPADDAEDLLRRMARSAEYHLAEGDTDRGRVLLERVVASADAGAQKAELLLRLGRAQYLSDEVGAAGQLFAEARAEAGDDPRLAAATEQALAFTAMFGGDIPRAVEHARAALDLAEPLGDPGLLALALCRVGLTEFLAGKGLDSDRMKQAVALEHNIEHVPFEWLPSYAYAGMAVFADDLATSRRLYADLYPSALESGDERTISTLAFAMSQLECAAGNWGDADRFASEAVERSRQSGLATLQANALSAQAMVSALLGRSEAARAAAGQGLENARRAGAAAPYTWITATLGFLELSLGDPQAAHRQLGPLSQMIAEIGVAEPGVVRFLPDEIEALIALGELEQAHALAEMLEQRGLAVGRPWAKATGARSLALVAAASGDLGAARDAMDRAFAAHEGMSQPFELARTLLAKGIIERRAKQRAVAREALDAARDSFAALGARLWVKKAADELARIPGRGPTSDELTVTQRRVADLVAEGHSNKEVAATLFVTVRTVEANLSRVYAKLGLRSRTELARRLADPPEN